MTSLPPAQDPLRPAAVGSPKVAAPRVIRRAALALALAGATAFGFIVYSAYRGDDSSRHEVPLITADNAPLREKPEDEGGMEIANRDSTVYDSLNNHVARPGLERLMPLPEQPIDGPAAAPDPRRPDGTPALTAAEIKLLHQQQNRAAGDAAEQAMDQLASAANDVPQGVTMGRTSTMVLTEKIDAPAAPTATASAPQVVAAAPALDDTSETAAVTEEPAATTVAVAPKPTPAEVKAAASVKPAAGASARVVQLGAVRSQDAAKAEWARLQKKYKSQLGGLEPSYQQADLGARGVYWRIRGGPVSAEQGKQICAALAKDKQNCMVVGK